VCRTDPLQLFGNPGSSHGEGPPPTMACDAEAVDTLQVATDMVVDRKDAIYYPVTAENYASRHIPDK
jgi:hypothetical protein